MNQIPYSDGCQVCGKPPLRYDGKLYCANEQCENYQEVIA